MMISSPRQKLRTVRTVPLPEPVVRLLTTWRSRTKRGKTEDFIFAGREGVSGDHKRMIRDYINRLARSFAFLTRRGSRFGEPGDMGGR
jgi:hypothetical protein